MVPVPHHGWRGQKMPCRSRTTDLPKAMRVLVRLKTLLEREGFVARWRRKLLQLGRGISKRGRIWRMRSRPGVATIEPFF